MKENYNYILEKYDFGNILEMKPYGNGHINKTFLIKSEKGNFILQGVNKQVFPFPEKIIENINFLHKIVPDNNIIMPIIPGKDGQIYYDEKDLSWRVFPFADGYLTYEKAENLQIAERIAYGYAYFVKVFSEVDTKKLNFPILNFHNIDMRYDDLKVAYEKSSEKLQSKAMDLYNFIQSNYMEINMIQSEILKGNIPIRTTHNDTKINNILLSENNFFDVKVIDLDTVMPSSLLFDFGDMCRSACNFADENTKNKDEISFSLEVFEALCKGYSYLKDILTLSEKKYLDESVLYITLMLAMRFLTDYLQGNIYFKVKNEDDNFNRAENQLILFKDILNKKPEMEKIIKKYFY